MSCQLCSTGVGRWCSMAAALSGSRPTLRGLGAGDGIWDLIDEKVHWSLQGGNFKQAHNAQEIQHFGEWGQK